MIIPRIPDPLDCPAPAIDLKVSTMTGTEALEKLRAGHSEIQGRFEVERLGLFGSAARDELREDSDVDILVKFHGPTRYDSYRGLQQALEALLGRRVDLVTESGLKPRARAGVARDLIHVA
jgi:hypothetical protein